MLITRRQPRNHGGKDSRKAEQDGDRRRGESGSVLAVMPEAFQKNLWIRGEVKTREGKQSYYGKKGKAKKATSLKPPGIHYLSLNPTAGLCWNASMSCCVTGWVGLSLQSLHWWDLWERYCCGVWLFCTEGESLRVKFQYSAAYSVPWSPLHSNVNSFTISFILRLFTRSLRDRGNGKENKRIKTNMATKTHQRHVT